MPHHPAPALTTALALLQPIATCQTATGVSQQFNSNALTFADAGMLLKFRRLHGGVRVIQLHEEQGDASSEKSPPDASPDSERPPQPPETAVLNSS